MYVALYGPPRDHYLFLEGSSDARYSSSRSVDIKTKGVIGVGSWCGARGSWLGRSKGGLADFGSLGGYVPNGTETGTKFTF